MEISPDKLPILSLVQRAQRKEIALPQFQRNFVWPRDDVADLVLSVLKGYFIGTFLFLDVDKEHLPFAVRAIAGVRGDPEDIKPDMLILDGQQRLTSLHYVLSAPDEPLKNTSYPYRFFLDLRKLLDGNDDGLVFSLRFDQCEEYATREGQFQKWVLPFTEVPRWTEWKDAYEDWLFDRDRDDHERYRRERRQTWNKVLDDFVKFQVPIIKIPKVKDDDADAVAEVCAIFEKLNSTGVALSVYDLLTARLYKYGIDLHSLWKTAIEDNPKLKEFSGGEPDSYGVLLLRTIALLRRQEVKSKALINLNQQDFVDDWNRAVAAMEKALERLVAVHRDGFGVFDTAWQPYTTLAPVLAASLDTAEKNRAEEHAYRDIKCWYWGAVFLQRYAGSVETRTYRDAMDLLRRQTEPDFVPEIFGDIRRNLTDNTQFSLKEVARVNSVYRAVMNLIAINGAKDFQNNDGVTFHDMEDHHIFPRAFLRDTYGYTSGEKVNTILNRTLICASTNRRISRMMPSQYLNELVPDVHRDAILRSHLIGPEAQSAMERDDYEAFLIARENDILAFLRSYLEVA